jgi:hypothetical protein
MGMTIRSRQGGSQDGAQGEAEGQAARARQSVEGARRASRNEGQDLEHAAGATPEPPAAGASHS